MMCTDHLLGLTHKLPGRRTALLCCRLCGETSGNGITGLNTSTNSIIPSLAAGFSLQTVRKIFIPQDIHSVDML